jgi:thiol-disulfide isomerase/thioredoxin
MKPRLIIACLTLGTTLVASAETWRTRKGNPIEGTLSGVYGNMALISARNGSWQIPIDEFDDASLVQVAAFLAAPPKQTAWKNSESKLAKAFSKRLQRLQDGKLVNFDPGAQSEPEFYAVYFGAFWCGPCRRFSPRLVEAYARMQAREPGRFEVIFVSDDVDPRGQLDYVREVKMPWPILRYASCGKLPVIDSWRGRGIPCLVVLNRDGELLYHSYKGEEYLGPDEPLEKLEQLLETTRDGAADKPAVNLHRLTLARHVHAAQGGSLAPKVYLASLDALRPANLPPDLRAQVTVDPQGHVKDVSFTPQLDAVTSDLLTRGVERWLFLPAVKDGRATEAAIEVPIVIRRS